MLAIVAVELLPNALSVLTGWWVAAAFAAGGLAYIGVQTVLRWGSITKDRTGMWMIYIAVAIDLVSDGLMLGAGSAVSMDLGLTLAAGQVLAFLSS